MEVDAAAWEAAAAAEEEEAARAHRIATFQLPDGCKLPTVDQKKDAPTAAEQVINWIECDITFRRQHPAMRYWTKEERRNKMAKAVRQEFGRRMIAYMYVRRDGAPLPSEDSTLYGKLHAHGVSKSACVSNHIGEGGPAEGKQDDEQDGEQDGEGKRGAGFWYEAVVEKASQMLRS